MKKTKPFAISKGLVREAYKRVKANAGGAGIDRQSLRMFEENASGNLYKIWNRLSSGSYFPPAVKAVSIPKRSGGERILGVPTVSDRIAQMVIKLVFEPEVESIFYPDSYGYRPNKSALEAIGVTRQRCWKYDWVLEFDIKGLFDNIDHGLLMKAVRKRTENKWVILYIERWLKAPMQNEGGALIERNKGTPQGGVISPVLSNLFLHYVFDAWMSRNFPEMKWCRYADDGLVHCKTKEASTLIRSKLEKRFQECGLELHPDKTKIVYCKDGRRTEKYSQTSFMFLGYVFQRRSVKNKQDGSIFLGFIPTVSREARKSMQAHIRQQKIHLKSYHTLEGIAGKYNPMIRGWINYYGRYSRSYIYPVLVQFNRVLVKWARRKYKSLSRHKTRATNFLRKIARERPTLFAHWSIDKMTKDFI